MLILLPPSEGKTPAVRGSAVDWPSLSFPELNTYRAKVLEALGTVSAHEDALALLGVGASLKDDVERNTRLHAEPAAPAHQIYSGVLYDALGYKTLTPAQRRKADDSVLVVSALWGAIRFADRVPAYRLSMGTALPDVGRLASFWKPQLPDALARRRPGSCWWTAAPAPTPRRGRRRRRRPSPSTSSRRWTACARWSATSPSTPAANWRGTCWPGGATPRRRRRNC